VSVHREFLGLDDRIRQGYGAMAEVLHAVNWLKNRRPWRLVLGFT
jgi:hypothetical protein